MTEVDVAGFLGQMAHESRQRVEEARAQVPEEAMRQRALASGVPPSLSLRPTGFDIIAEVKLRSPSEGDFAKHGEPAQVRVAAQAKTYSAAGAVAISVLTEPNQFAGDLEHIGWATEVTEMPVMRKDFLVDAYQIFEARAGGAAGVLLIARILDDLQIQELADVARALGMFVLLECFDERDVDRVRDLWQLLARDHGDAGEVAPPGVAPLLVGVNCRDLTTLNVEFDRLAKLAPRLPEGAITVAESGLLGPDQAATVAAAGYRLALVGSALMRAPEPAELLATMLTRGRSEVECASA